MAFKDIKVGFPVYFLHKDDEVRTSQGKVTAVSAPHVNTPINPGFGTSALTSPMVVDVTIEENGTTKTYTIPENLSVTYAGSVTISTDREGILREVEALLASKEEAIRNIERDRKTVDDCKKILVEFNPAYKEKKETEERFAAMEGKLNDVTDLIKSLVDKLK